MSAAAPTAPTGAAPVKTDDNELFDVAPYELPVPKIDGERTDKAIIAFGGQIELDPKNGDDLLLLEALKLNQEVTLTVEAKVGGKGWRVKSSEENGDTITHLISVKPHTIYTHPEGI